MDSNFQQIHWLVIQYFFSFIIFQPFWPFDKFPCVQRVGKKVEPSLDSSLHAAPPSPFLYVSCPRPRIRHLSQDPWSFSWRAVLEVKGCYIWVWLLTALASERNEKEIYEHKVAHISTNISTWILSQKHTFIEMWPTLPSRPPPALLLALVPSETSGSHSQLST